MFAKSGPRIDSWRSRAVIAVALAAALGGCQTAPEATEPSAEETVGAELIWPRPCASSNQCPRGNYCTVDDGVCNPPPGCGPGQSCPTVCYGTCQGFRTEAALCRYDSDCRTFSDYCTGCDCRALGATQKDPVCKGPGVQCFVDPCLDKTAVCEAGRCVISGGSAAF